MNWTKGVVIFFILFSCSQKNTIQEESIPVSQSLVEVDYVSENLDRSDFKVIDIRKPEDFENGHLKGAINVWRSELENHAYPYGGMMPSREQLQNVLRNIGINQNDEIVIYDDIAECDAARLWFVLKTYHVSNVKLMNGGLHAWKAAGFDVDKQSITSEKGNIVLSEKLPMDWVEFKENIRGDVVVIDTRTHDEYTGKRQKKGAQAAGRIPGSIRIDWAETVNWGGDMKFKTLEELEEIYTRRGIDRDNPVIVYCHSGVRSAHTTFVLTELLGFKNVRNYDGSWTEWSHFTDLPIEKDSVTIYFD